MVISTALIIKIVIIVAVIIAAALIVKTIVRSARRAVNSAEAQLIRHVVNTATEHGFDFDQTPPGPKKISNMTKILRPAIERDFPRFDWGEIRHMVELAVKEQYPDKSGFTIHETAISRYEKSGGSIIIGTESSVSYDEGSSKRYFAVQCELSYLNYKTDDAQSDQQPHTLNCPNCRAPLSRNAAGELFCEYCGTIVIGEKTWQITEIKEK